MSKAAELAALIGSQSALSNRNLIINGAMQCWQRTTSVTTSGSGTFSADRWASNAGASTVFSRSTDVPTGFQFSISVAGSVFTGIRTRIEAADCKKLAGQKVTFSWYAKRTAGTGDMKTFLGYASAEDNFGTVTLIEEVVNTASASVSSDWARYTYTVTLPASAVNGLHFVIFNGSASGSVTTLYTGVQLELGEQATPFEHRSYGEELALCKRYFHAYGGGVDEYPVTGVWTGSEAIFPFTFAEMRAAPTVTSSAANTFKAVREAVAWSTGTSVSVSTITKQAYSMVLTASSDTRGYASRLHITTSAYIHADAEL